VKKKEDEYKKGDVKETTKTEEDKKEESRLVLPGEVIVDSLDVMPGTGTYRKGSKIYSKFVGMTKKRGSIVFVVPLSGVYIPKVGDVVIGEIVEAGFSFWLVDIGSPYDAQLGAFDIKEYVEKDADLTRYLDVGDLVVGKITKVTKSKFVNLSTKDSYTSKLNGGYVVTITPSKVPRLIGKNGSMINIIKEKTGCNIVVGQNGRVWIKGGNEKLAFDAIKKVEKLATISGLTDTIEEFLDKELKKKKG